MPLVALLALLAIASFVQPALAMTPAGSSDADDWPAGTEVVPFENLDGVILFRAAATGADGRDTSGFFVLDTGAGTLALDGTLAIRLGLTGEAPRGSIGITDRPLPRLQVGHLVADQISPVMTFDAEIIRRVADRPVFGLYGQRLMQDRALWLDYASERLALIPATATGSTSIPPDSSAKQVRRLLSRDAVPLPFHLAGDGKALVRVRVVPRVGSPTPWLTFVLDTGASKCVLFENVPGSSFPTADWAPTIRGLVAPTLLGKSEARLVRCRRIYVGGADPAGSRAVAPAVDVVLLSSPLATNLARVVGEPVHGLLGYSFFRRFRVLCDYPGRVLWLDPIKSYRDDRPYEHCHVGLQLERQSGTPRVVAVAEGSPGARAGIRTGDSVLEVDGKPASNLSILDLSRLMEGRPGTGITLTLRREGVDTAYRLRRQRLL